MDLYGFVWICMDSYRFAYICIDLQVWAGLSGTKRERPGGTGEAVSDLSVRFPVFGRQWRSELTFSNIKRP